MRKLILPVLLTALAGCSVVAPLAPAAKDAAVNAAEVAVGEALASQPCFGPAQVSQNAQGSVVVTVGHVPCAPPSPAAKP
jgi:hypothetical protein